jgi:hypothetical protein
MTPTAQSKSLLAKLLATENISIRQDSSAKTASFDVKNRVLTLPVWQGISEDLNDMLIIHEVGHALDTPCDGWLDAMKRIAQDVHGDKDDRYVMAVKGFLNVIEDARIDRRQKLRYPGSRRNYLGGYKELIERDFFGLSNRDPNTLSFIDRANLYFKGGSLNMNLEFSSEERSLLSRMDNTETFEDVIKLTEEIYRLAATRKDDKQELESDDFAMSDDGEEVDFDEDGDDEDGDDEDGDDEKDSGRESVTKQSDDDKTDEDFVPKSETDEAYEKARESLADGSLKYVYVSMPKPVLKEIILDYKSFLKDHEKFYSKLSDAYYHYESDWLSKVAVQLAKIRNEENNTISYMVKEFEQRKAADIYSRQSIAKTGVIDTNKLHSYRYNDDIFRRLSIVPNGKNHGFVMFLDWSGSMQSNLKYTIRQLMTLTMFCKRVQIPFEVYLFRDGDVLAERFERDDFTTEGYFSFAKDFVLRNVLSSRMNANELNRAYLYLWAAALRVPSCERMQGTPLNEAIYVADEIVNNFRIKNKLQVVNTIFLTDGDSNWTNFKDSSTHEYSPISGQRIRKIYIYQDPKTKKEYTLSDGGDTRALTTALLKVLKDRTNSNLVGFYLYESSSFTHVQRRFFDAFDVSEYTKNNSKLWNEKFFVPVMTAGYDEYYIINPKSFRSSEVPEKLNVDSTMSKSKVAKEFLRFSEKKAINRLLLSRFMERVAGKVKNAA